MSLLLCVSRYNCGNLYQSPNLVLEFVPRKRFLQSCTFADANFFNASDRLRHDPPMMWPVRINPNHRHTPRDGIVKRIFRSAPMMPPDSIPDDNQEI